MSGLCHIPPETPVNTVVYRDMSTHIDVAESRCSGMRWWVSMCVRTRERNQFPSVLLQPLGHLSVSLESTACSVSSELFHTSSLIPSAAAITFGFRELKCIDDRSGRKLCKTPKCGVSTYGDSRWWPAGVCTAPASLVSNSEIDPVRLTTELSGCRFKTQETHSEAERAVTPWGGRTQRRSLPGGVYA